MFVAVFELYSRLLWCALAVGVERVDSVWGRGKYVRLIHS